MNLSKRVLFATISGMCLMTGTSVMALDPPTTEELAAALNEHNAALIDTLMADGSPRALTLAATAMAYPLGNPEGSAETQINLLARAAQMAPDDAWVQWIAAVNFQPSETVSEPALALQRLEPDNGAVWMFQLQAANLAEDSAAVTDALARIGAARKFDDRYVASALEWLKVLRNFPTPAPFVDAAEPTSERDALIAAFGRGSAISMVNYTPATRACKPQDQALAADRRAACLAAGRLMLTESNTSISMRIGAALLRLAGADDAAEITRNIDYLTQKYGVVATQALEDPNEFERYQADLLQTRSEVQAMKNMLTRAGVPLLPPSNWNEDPSGSVAAAAKRKDN